MMRASNKMRFMPMILTLLLVVVMAVPITHSEAYESPETVILGTASSFAVLAGSTITNTGPTTVGGTAGGNIGLHPGAGPIETFPGQEDVTLSVTDSVYLNDVVAEQAKVDLVTAYNTAVSRATDETISADLGGRILTPGVYTSASSMGITGTLTLDGGGDPNAVFIFQAGSTLTTASESEIRLINDAQPCRIFWQVGSSATLGTDSYFVGHILALESITATTRVEVQGQLLARNGAVTLDSNTITNDVCLSSGSLRVTKDVQGSVNDMTLPDFEITVTGPYDFSGAKTIEAGTSYTWEGLASGTYTVSEEALSEEWNVSGTGEHDVQLGETTEITITNAYISNDDTSNGSDDDTSNGSNDDTSNSSEVDLSYGELTVTKVVSGDNGDVTLPLFGITVTGPGGFSATRTFVNGESYTWENLVPGVYTVTENRMGLSSEWRVSGEGTVQVSEDQTALTTITNAYFPEVETSNGSDDELLTADQTDLTTTPSGNDEETLVLGIVELPKTGDNPLLMTSMGLLLSGLGLWLRRKENKTNSNLNT